MTTHDDALPARFTLAEVAAFLDGSGTLDGVAFGKRHPTEPGAYWWRKHLSATLAAAPTPPALHEAVDILRKLLSHYWSEDCQECAIGQSSAWADAKALIARVDAARRDGGEG
jgi:hypothetical protein